MKKILLALSAVLCLTFSTAKAQENTQLTKADPDELYAKDLLKPGTKAPDFRLRTYDTRVVRLSNYRGKYVVLDFWATWCPDCRKDIPAMKELYNTFSTRGVDFIGISFDTDREVWAKTAFETYQMNWIQVSELKKWKRGTQIDKLYKINWIPTMYLIDPQGRVVLGTVEIGKLKKALEELDLSNRIDKGPKAEFKGGQRALDDYMIANLKGVMKDPKMNVRADVVVQFNVTYTGEVVGAHVVEINNVAGSGTRFEKLSPAKQQQFIDKKVAEYKAEALRFMNSHPKKTIKHTLTHPISSIKNPHEDLKGMPAWEPATVNGKPVQTNQLLTLNFGVLD